MPQPEDDLIRVAMLGTQGQEVTELSDHTIDRLVAKLRPATLAEQTLLRAGVGNINDRAGRRPSFVTEDSGSPCEYDHRSECSPAMMRLVEGLLKNEHDRPLLAEVFPLLAAHDLRLPDRLLPDCLNLKDRRVRDAARETLGTRAMWLANFRKDWRWILRTSNKTAVVKQNLLASDQPLSGQLPELLRTQPPWSAEVQAFLGILPKPLDESTSRHVLDAIRGALHAPPCLADLEFIGACLQLVARSISPRLFHDALRPWTWPETVEPVLAVSLRRWWNEFERIVRLRQRIYQELNL